MNDKDRLVLAILIVLLLLAISTGCATRQNVLELGAGYDRHIDEGRNPQSVIRLRNEPKDGNGWVFEYNHNSSFTEGAPFNDRPEDLSDQYSIIYRFVF